MRSCILLLLLFALQLYANQSIAINTLTANGVTAGEAASLTDALRSELSKTGKFQVLERNQMEQVLKEQGFQLSGACDGTSCVIEMGRILAVQTMMLGSIGLVGKTYTISVRTVDVSSGKILQDITEYHKGELDGILTKVLPVIAKKLAGENVVQKNKRPAILIGVAAGVAVAAAIPIVYFALSGQDEPDATTTDVRVIWGDQ